MRAPSAPFPIRRPVISFCTKSLLYLPDIAIHLHLPLFRFPSAPRSPCFHTHSRCLPWGSVQDEVLSFGRGAAISCGGFGLQAKALNAVAPRRGDIEQTCFSNFSRLADRIILLTVFLIDTFLCRLLSAPAVPQRLVLGARYPQPMQQHCQLSRHCCRRQFPCAL